MPCRSSSRWYSSHTARCGQQQRERAFREVRGGSMCRAWAKARPPVPPVLQRAALPCNAHQHAGPHLLCGPKVLRPRALALVQLNPALELRSGEGAGRQALVAAAPLDSCCRSLPCCWPLLLLSLLPHLVHPVLAGLARKAGLKLAVLPLLPLPARRRRLPLLLLHELQVQLQGGGGGRGVARAGSRERA